MADAATQVMAPAIGPALAHAEGIGIAEGGGTHEGIEQRRQKHLAVQLVGEVVARLQRDAGRDVSAGFLAADETMRFAVAKTGALPGKIGKDREADFERPGEKSAARSIIIGDHDKGARARQKLGKRALGGAGFEKGAAVKIEKHGWTLGILSALIDARRDRAVRHLVQRHVLDLYRHHFVPVPRLEMVRALIIYIGIRFGQISMIELTSLFQISNNSAAQHGHVSWISFQPCAPSSAWWRRAISPAPRWRWACPRQR